MTISCVITDDEPIAQEILQDYVEGVSFLNLVNVCSNALETFSVLQQEQVDLLFLDIQMPEINGLDFLKSLKNPPEIIITTAYPEYALESYDLDVVDYLLKPISKERFLHSIEKAQKNLYTSSHEHHYHDEKKYTFFKANHQMIKVNFDEIIYVECLQDYAKVICEDRKIVTYSSMKAMAEQLTPSSFKRVHRSYIVNFDKIDSLEGQSFKIGENIIPIGKSYKKEVIKLVEKGI